ncbi:hypothetical protein [Desulfobacter vibrioformis]|uniref:hypothetical protein n=1 Tax=Desulfobacter vibrioformis TaxID=34031 RepID=UPI00055233A1|nr:hypothetical protein [Desulfobacter vibrioformis]
MRKTVKKVFTKMKTVCTAIGAGISKVSNKTKTACAAIGAGITGTVLTAKPAKAALDLSTVTVDTSDYVAIATFLIGALVAFWGIKKGLGLLGR